MKLVIPLFLLGMIWSCTSKNSEISEWRGEDRKGIYHESNLLKEWPEEGPEEIWYQKGIGDGFGSPVVAGDRIYITGTVDSTALLHCLSLEGEIIWQKPYGSEWVANFPGSRSAPTIVDELIYVGSGMGNLFCLELETGNVVWSMNFVDDFQGVDGLFGHSESAVIEGNKVFWTAGGEKHNVVAMDRFTGEIVWSNPGHGERSAYNPPLVIKLPERSILVTFSAYHLMGLDTETGELLWSHEQDLVPAEKREPGEGDVHANTVIFENGHIFYATGAGNCAVKLMLSEDGSTISEVWRNRGFDSYMGGIVKIGNYIYGSGIGKPSLRALDATTGELTDSLKIGRGAIIEADQLLYYYNWKGDMHLVDYRDGKVKEVSSFKITRGKKEHFSHPVIHKGVLFQRHGDVLMAFDISFD